jgi:hypothetical protein
LLALNVYRPIPPVAAIPLLYVLPTIPSGREVVVIVSVLGITAAAIVMLKFVDADCAAGCVESVIVTATVFVLAEPCAGVPVIAPVE